MPSLLLTRHGQASFGAADYDVLSELGRVQAQVLATELTRRDLNVARIITGSLTRQRDTIAPLAESVGLESTTDRRWDEYDSAGILSAHSTTSARQQRQPGDGAPAISSRDFQVVLEQALLAWIAAEDDSPAQESWAAFATRTADALSAAAAGLGSGETAVVCSSSGVIAAIAVQLLELPATAFVALNRVGINASITRVASGSTGLTLVSYNEHSYLDGPSGSRLTSYR